MTGGLWDLLSTEEAQDGVDPEKVTQAEPHRRRVSLVDTEADLANANVEPGQVLTREAAKRFEQVNLVGSGGMGAVYCARDRNLLREVAIKVLSPSLANDPKYIKRFHAEAQIQAQLDHPNIVPVHDLALDSEKASYFIMRLVHGRTLADWIISAHASPTPHETMREMLGAFLKVCDAMAFAHSRGVLHLDVKPENILMEDFGTVYLMDWGLARLSSRDPKTEEAVSLSPEAAGGADSGVVGSPSYMSPEQAMGSIDQVSERTDVFGLGAMLYAILAGRAPYLADSIEEVLQKARLGQMPPLPDIPLDSPLLARVCTIARKAMAMDPNERHRSVLELKHEIEESLQGGIAFPIKTFAAGERIVTEGESADTAYIVASGTCVEFVTRDGKRSTLRQLGAGSVFGEEAVFNPGPGQATVEAMGNVSVRLVTRKMLDEGLGRDSWFGSFVVALGNRLQPAGASAFKEE